MDGWENEVGGLERAALVVEAQGAGGHAATTSELTDQQVHTANRGASSKVKVKASPGASLKRRVE